MSLSGPKFMVSREIFLVGKMIKFWLLDEILSTFPRFSTNVQRESMTVQTSRWRQNNIKRVEIFLKTGRIIQQLWQWTSYSSLLSPIPQGKHLAKLFICLPGQTKFSSLPQHTSKHGVPSPTTWLIIRHT